MLEFSGCYGMLINMIDRTRSGNSAGFDINQSSRADCLALKIAGDAWENMVRSKQ